VIVLHADFKHDEPRQVPLSLTRGEFGRFGFDSGAPSKLKQSDHGKWELDITNGWPSSIRLDIYDPDDCFYGDTDGDGV